MVIIFLEASDMVCLHEFTIFTFANIVYGSPIAMTTKKDCFAYRLWQIGYVFVIPEPYSPRSARIHLARVLELLRVSGPQDALKDGCSPSVLDTLTYTPTAGTHITPHTYCTPTVRIAYTKRFLE